jgi:hypothetical protein
MRKHSLVRAAAALSIGGLAVLLPVTTAGAATVDVNVDPLGIDLGLPGTTSGTDASSTPTANTTDGTVQPLPGATAQVPATASNTTNVTNPVSGATSTAPNLATASADVNACATAAVNTGSVAPGCATSSDSSSSSSGSFVDELNRLGACARVALAAGEPIDTCRTAPAGSAAAAALLGGADGTGAVCLPAMLNVGTGTCSGVDTSSVLQSAAAAGNGGAGTAAGNICLGLAVLGTGDPSACTANEITDPTNGGGNGNGNPAGNGNGTSVADLASADGSGNGGSVLDAAARVGGDALAFTGSPAGILALAGSALVGSGWFLRRRAARLV